MTETIIALTTFLFFSIFCIIYVILKLKKCSNDFEEIFYHASMTEGQLPHDNTRILRIKKIAQDHIGESLI